MSLEAILLCFQFCLNLLGNGAVGGVDAGFIAAIHFFQLAIFQKDRNHATLINGATVAAEKQFFFHLQILHNAKAHGADAQPGGGYGLQLVTVQQSAGGNFPIVGAAVYINPDLLAV